MNEPELQRASLTDGRVVSLLLVGVLVVLALVHGLREPTAASTGTAEWAIELLAAIPTNDDGAPPDQPYDRDSYGGWVDLDGDCKTVRHEVLAAESLTAVTWTDERECKVEAGSWVDPYTGERLGLASDVSIDHVISLSESHHAGAWGFPPQWKEALFNDIGDPATLAVTAMGSNSAKGSLDASQWLPEGEDARCHYAVARVRIRARWSLSITSAERSALEQALSDCAEADLPREPESSALVVVDVSGAAPMPAPSPTPRILGGCDERYEGVCIPVSPDDLDCPDIEPRRFAVGESDPHRFDGNADGVGCEVD